MAKWHKRIASLLESGDYQQAINFLGGLLEEQPNNNTAWLMKGRIHSSLGDHEESLRCIDSATPRDSEEEAELCSLRAAELGLLGRYLESLESCERALELNPWEVNAWSNKGYALSVLGKYEEALSAFDKALYFPSGLGDTWKATVWHAKALTLRRIKRVQEALECASKAVELDPKEESYKITKREILAYLEG